ncbi:MAG: hypothetical protein RLZ18_958 [Actinomycetota bacterium]|jgi:AcrR family transcriptional regulator
MSEEKHKRVDGLETMERLLSFADVELNEVGSVKFNLGRVLEKAQVSKSSAYHHFGSRDGIIAAVEARSVAVEIEQVNLQVRAFVESAQDVNTAVEYLKILVYFTSDSSGVRARRRRAATLVAAQNSQTLAEIIGQTQRDGAQYLAETFQIVEDRGWISPSVPLLGIAHWMLASAFGHILVDYVDDPLANELWAEATFTSLISLLKPNI